MCTSVSIVPMNLAVWVGLSSIVESEVPPITSVMKSRRCPTWLTLVAGLNLCVWMHVRVLWFPRAECLVGSRRLDGGLQTLVGAYMLILLTVPITPMKFVKSILRQRLTANLSVRLIAPISRGVLLHVQVSPSPLLESFPRRLPLLMRVGTAIRELCGRSIISMWLLWSRRVSTTALACRLHML